MKSNSGSAAVNIEGDFHELRLCERASLALRRIGTFFVD
jgi:hypothetical protein